ncbi:MAG: ABC transporter ATP-binding protein [Afipia sp.]|nr:ABC transporter ATP-binding protein [Afipia sp.]
MADNSQIALRAVGLHKHFGGLNAVSDVSLDVKAGEIHAVIGPNGAGKSTLINLLSGDLSLNAGEILLGDRDITTFGADKRARAGVGRSYQKTTIFQHFTAQENVRLAAQAHSASPLKMSGGIFSDDVVTSRTRDALERAGLTHRANLTASHLSHGEQRQLEIAMVLATQPRVILLDEPLAGMGQAEARGMVALIASLKLNRAVLVVEHDMDAVFELADRLTVMADGQVIASGLPQMVRNDPAVKLAYLGDGDAA